MYASSVSIGAQDCPPIGVEFWPPPCGTPPAIRYVFQRLKIVRKTRALDRSLTAGGQAAAPIHTLWGTIAEQGLLDGTVIISDGAGQFRNAEHALCWVHAERLIHKLDTFCEAYILAKEQIRARIWRLYKALNAYRLAPSPRRAAQLHGAETGGIRARI